jgi:hypothetical protein
VRLSEALVDISPHKGSIPLLVLGNLNVNFDNFKPNDRNVGIAADMSDLGVKDMATACMIIWISTLGVCYKMEFLSQTSRGQVIVQPDWDLRATWLRQ